MSTIVYACLTAAGMVFADLPCDRPAATTMSEQNAMAFAAVVESPPRIPEGWGMDPIQQGSYRPRWSRGAYYPAYRSFHRAAGPARARR